MPTFYSNSIDTPLDVHQQPDFRRLPIIARPSPEEIPQVQQSVQDDTLLDRVHPKSGLKRLPMTGKPDL